MIRAGKRMLTIMAILMFACAAAPAQTPAETVQAIDLWSVREQLNNAILIAQKGDEGYQFNVEMLIDQTLHLLRSPRPGGDGYYLASVDKNKSTVMELATTKVDAVMDSGQFQQISGQIALAYELEIHAPPQRAAFKNNGDTFVKAYRVEYIIDGAKKTVESKFEDWVHRKDRITVPLPGLCQWVRIEIDAAVKPQDVNHTVIQLNARVPEINDDERNPYTYSISQIKVAREYNGFQGKRDKVISLLQAALLGLDYVPAAAGAVKPAPAEGAGNTALIEQLDYILFLLDGTPEEQAGARKKLDELLASMRGEIVVPE